MTDNNAELVKKRVKFLNQNIDNITQFYADLEVLYSINAAQNKSEVLNKVCMILSRVFLQNNINMMEVFETRNQATTYNGSDKALTTSKDLEVARNAIPDVSNFFPLK